MTTLARTDLTTSDKAHLAAAALAVQGGQGSATELADTFSISRPTVYSAARTAEDVLSSFFSEGGDALGGCGAQVVVVDEAQLRRAAVALRSVAPNSIRAIEELIPLLYPGVSPSYGKVQGILAEAEKRAAVFNATAELGRIKAAALDEMFSQGDPVLAGVDLESGYLFALSLRESRAADDWAEVLEQSRKQGLALEVVVKDAALGIAAGVARIYPEAEQRDDCFHAIYEMGKLRRRLERRAYGAMSREAEAEQKLGKVRRTGRGDRSNAAGELAWARRRCGQALELHDDFEVAMREAREAMEVFDLSTGKLRTAEQIEASVRAAASKMQSIDDAACSKVGRYISNRAEGLSKYARQLNECLGDLAEQYSDTLVRLGCGIWRLRSDLRDGRRPWARWDDRRKLVAALDIFVRLAGSEADEVMRAIDDAFQHRFRASSAIEGFNAALRPFLYVHKGVTSGFLELFRARYNLRIRRWGRHKGTSAHECLNDRPEDDWLSLLGYLSSATAH